MVFWGPILQNASPKDLFASRRRPWLLRASSRTSCWPSGRLPALHPSSPICMCVYTYIGKKRYMRVYMYISMYTHTYIHIHICMYTIRHVYIYIYIHVYICLHMHGCFYRFGLLVRRPTPNTTEALSMASLRNSTVNFKGTPNIM